MAAPATMTKESVRALIDGVENDPLAGLGCFSKKDWESERTCLKIALRSRRIVFSAAVASRRV